ncbi:MAG TPA: septum formation initiator family protein [Candidatus Deferrimicrobium sp.]|nr:septum formation initiator family protein [Candidatus Deferrimicrobium sp.]
MNARIQQKRRSSKIRKYRIHSLLLIALIAGILGAFYPAYVWSMQLDSELAGLAQDKTQLVQKNQNLQEEIRRLNTPDYVEQLARRELGLVKPGEVPITQGIPGNH